MQVNFVLNFFPKFWESESGEGVESRLLHILYILGDLLCRVSYCELIRYISDKPVLDAASVSAREDGDVIQVSWAAPSGYFTALTLIQCHDADEEHESNCSRHDVTNVTALIVNRTDGTVLTLVVWQDGENVLSYQIPLQSDSSETKQNGIATWGICVLGLY